MYYEIQTKLKKAFNRKTIGNQWDDVFWVLIRGTIFVGENIV